MVYELKKTSQFKASYKLAKKRGLDISLLEDIVEKLRTDKPLEKKYHNHELSGKFKGVWEFTFSQISCFYITRIKMCLF